MEQNWCFVVFGCAPILVFKFQLPYSNPPTLKILVLRNSHSSIHQSHSLETVLVLWQWMHSDFSFQTLNTKIPISQHYNPRLRIPSCTIVALVGQIGFSWQWMCSDFNYQIPNLQIPSPPMLKNIRFAKLPYAAHY